MLRERLAQAERHVAEGEVHISRQRRIVTELEGNGHDTGMATRLLRSFEESQAFHIEHRDRLRRELGF